MLAVFKVLLVQDGITLWYSGHLSQLLDGEVSLERTIPPNNQDMVDVTLSERIDSMLAHVCPL